MAGQQRTVLEVLGAVKSRFEEVERKLESRPSSPNPVPTRLWRESASIKARFVTGKFDLSPEVKKTLDARFPGEYPREFRVEIVGHTDPSGSPQRNAALSLARAQEVRDYLIVDRRVPAASIVTVGRQNSASSFGSPAENRVVTIRVFEGADTAAEFTVTGARGAN